MCNFMGYRVTGMEYVRLKELEISLGTSAALAAYQDGFLYAESAVLIKDRGQIEVQNMHWEFIPEWITRMEQVVEARKKGIPWLNAKSETMLESKMFRDAALKRRCLVLATHFFEWRHYKPAGQKKDIKYPYLVKPKTANNFFIAGIYNPFTDRRTGETFDSFAVVTTQANKLMQEVHNSKQRMPAILTEELAIEWLEEGLSEQRIKEIATSQYPHEEMNATTIRRDFKLAEDPLEAFWYEELPAIVF